MVVIYHCRCISISKIDKRFANYLLRDIFVGSNGIFMLKNFCIVSITCLFTLNSYAQQITGKVVDAQSQEPLPYASIALLNTDSVVVTSVTSLENGSFSLSAKKGNYTVQIYYVGYDKKQINNLAIIGNKELGDIALQINASYLNEVEVRGERSNVVHQIDRQVYDSKQFQSAQGGTATDVIRNLPSITVNAEGTISMRGGGFIVLLNGKPIQGDPALVLGQIPANSITDIEVITTPSAKYDADGKAGILNIKTKRGMDDGFFAVINTQVGLPAIQNYDNEEGQKRYGADLTLNYKKNNWEFSLGGAYTRNDMSGQRVGNVNTTINDTLTQFPSVGERSFDRYNQSLRAAISYSDAENKNVVNMSAYTGKRTQYRIANIHYYNNEKSIASTEAPVSSFEYFNYNLVKRLGDFSIGSIDYAHQFKNKSTLSASTLYEYTELGGPTENINVDYRQPNTTDTLQYTRNDNQNPLHGFRFNFDYSIPTKLGKVEMGYQYRYLIHTGDFIYEVRNESTKEFEMDPLFTNSLDLQRQIHSVYSQLSGSKDKLTYDVGLRYEYAKRVLNLAKGDSPDPYIINPLFPAINFGYYTTDNTRLKAAYNRRIERTTTFKMNPFPEREHSETLEQGDANLLPEFIDVFELGVVNTGEKNTLSATLYYQNIKNVINRVNTIYNDTILNRIYTNAGTAQAIGLELVSDLKITDWFSLYTSANFYNYSIKGELFDTKIPVDAHSFSYTLNVNATAQVIPTMSVQVSLNYQSRKATAQGEDSQLISPHMSIKKSFLKGRLVSTLQWQNISMGLIPSNEQRIATWSRTNLSQPGFYTTTNYKHEVDIIMINLTYQLNSLKPKLKFTKSEFGDKEF